MSTSYAIVPAALPASITIPEDLVDQRSAASVNDPLTTVANGVGYLGQTVTLYRRMGCGDPVGVSGAIGKTHDLNNVALGTWGTAGFALLGDSLVCTTNSDSVDTYHVLYDVTPLLADGATITQATVELIGNTSHLPAVMPSIGLSQYRPATAAWTSLLAAGVANDTTATGAAYAAMHNIVLTPDQNEIVELESYVYYLVVCPEAGSGSLAGLKLKSVTVTMSGPRYQR